MRDIGVKDGYEFDKILSSAYPSFSLDDTQESRVLISGCREKYLVDRRVASWTRIRSFNTCGLGAPIFISKQSKVLKYSH